MRLVKEDLAVELTDEMQIEVFMEAGYVPEGGKAKKTEVDEIVEEFEEKLEDDILNDKKKK